MRFISLSLFLAVNYISQGQLLPDSAIHQQALTHAEAVYNRAMEGNFHIYNGSQYAAYQSQTEEHPYFLSDEWVYGNVLYDGEWFHNMPMLFDIEKEQLIVSYYFKGIKMQLNSQRVGQFSWQGHQFTNYQLNDSLGLDKGFYEILYNGPTRVVAKRKKTYIEEITGTELIKRFKETTQYYVLRNGQYVKAGTKKNALTLLKDRKKELKAFIRRNRLFLSEKENSLARVAAYYDSLQP
jgi:hypothetical protein